MGKALTTFSFRLNKDDVCHNPDRTQFQRDYDRIIFSTAFWDSSS